MGQSEWTFYCVGEFFVPGSPLNSPQMTGWSDRLSVRAASRFEGERGRFDGERAKKRVRGLREIAWLRQGPNGRLYPNRSAVAIAVAYLHPSLFTPAPSPSPGLSSSPLLPSSPRLRPARVRHALGRVHTPNDVCEAMSDTKPAPPTHTC